MSRYLLLQGAGMRGYLKGRAQFPRAHFAEKFVPPVPGSFRSEQVPKTSPWVIGIYVFILIAMFIGLLYSIFKIKEAFVSEKEEEEEEPDSKPKNGFIEIKDDSPSPLSDERLVVIEARAVAKAKAAARRQAHVRLLAGRKRRATNFKKGGRKFVWPEVSFGVALGVDMEVNNVDGAGVGTDTARHSLLDKHSVPDGSVGPEAGTKSKKEVESETNAESLEATEFNTVQDKSTATESDSNSEAITVVESITTADSKSSTTTDTDKDIESDTDSALDPNTDPSSLAEDSMLTSNEMSPSPWSKIDTSPLSPFPVLITDPSSSVEEPAVPATEPMRQRAKTIASGDILRGLSLLGSLGFRRSRSGREWDVGS